MGTSEVPDATDTPAATPGGLLSRPALQQRLDEGLAGRRLTLLVAPAGYGKTTLLRAWSGRQARSACLYYPLSEPDNDATHLLAGLRASIRAAWPGQGIPAWLRDDADVQGPLSYTLGRLFQQAAGATGREWLLLLDDYHLVTNREVHQALDTLLGQPAWPVRLAIASRGQPPLTAIARLRVEGRLLEMDETDLRFTREETQGLLAGSGLALREQELHQVAARTEGWPVALALLRQAAQREAAPALAALLGRLGDEPSLFDYLAGQVLERQPEAMQSFLRRTALLPYLSAGLCNAFLGIADAAALLDTLERQHLFVARLDEAPERRYRYHALFREFLSRSLEQKEGAAAVRGWRRRAAAGLLERPDLDDHAAAVEHLLAAQDWPAAADAVEAVAQRWDVGQYMRMAPWFDSLPPEVVAGRPRLLLALGLLRQGQGRWNEVLAALAGAEPLAQAAGTPEIIAQVWFQQAWAYFRLGHYAQAQDLCRQTLVVLSRPEAAHLARERARAHNLLGGCYAETDDLVRGEQSLQQAIQIYRQLGDRVLEAATLSNVANSIYLIQGRLAEAIDVGQQARRILDELGSYRVCYVLFALGVAYRLRGEYQAAHTVLERMLRLTDAHQDRMMRGYALYLLGHVHREQGRSEAARSCYDEARLLGEELREPFLLFEPRLGLALLDLAEGSRREAHRHGQAAWQQARAVSNRHQEGLALTAWGLILEQDGDTRQAEGRWREALGLMEALGAHYDQAALHLLLADLGQRRGQGEECRAHLETALALSRQYGYDFLFTGRERRRALPLLVAALGPDTPTGEEAGRLLAASGPEAVAPLVALLAAAPVEVQEQAVDLLGAIGDERAVPALGALQQHRRLQGPVREALARIAAAPRPPLRVRALGRFEVCRGETPTPAEPWQRRKTRLLLIYLLLRRGPVACDQVLEALWPDLSPESAGQSLNSACSELRRILEPHLARGMPSRYLERDEETMVLRRDGDFWYDAEAFEQAVRAGGQAARRALELYRGDFLPEEPYVDWVLRERERLHALYLNALTGWLEECLRAGNWREGAALARQILERERWLEEVWRALLTRYDRLGRRSEALQAYQECVCALREELDVAPAPETTALYEQMRGSA